MKKIFWICILLCSFKLKANCQSELGIIGGINFAKLHAPKNFEPVNNSFLTSFHVGLVTDFRLSFNLYFQPQFLLSGKGAKHWSDYQDTVSIKTFYFEIPLNILYKNAAGNGNFLVGLGPYIAGGMFGAKRNKHFNKKIKFGNKFNDDARTFDTGLNLIGGYEFKSGTLVNINYSLAVTDAVSGAFAPLARNRYLGISVGYFLGRNEK
ncbi:hypothetical protein EFY79_12510 [Hanamia caeni]|jgi:hypothetical protein|uniref:Outer membrane protein beta-barrel domain-containing protein n=1 Tax=Hanamia caeni TaxID=2294116 RepID=A0A3M9ND73_9BACT|nr:outer membrane beta-barrel protein [Hanamia caeni]RNI35772.1 hypothetical protein EFY79_12510 [Hanamia caeni]